MGILWTPRPGERSRALAGLTRRNQSLVSAVAVLLVLAVTVPTHGAENASEGPAAASSGAAGVSPGAPGSRDAGYILLNQRFIEGLYTEGPDLEDVDAVFWYVFSRLPEAVTVYPSENYYYFQLYVSGRQIWGNLRLPAGRRDNGVLSFGYAEYNEFPSYGARYGLTRSKFFTDADGLLVRKVDDFTYVVRFRGREVTFHLHKLSQKPPSRFQLGPGERFIERTFDESGYQFFLLFNEKRNYFFWVLNEEVTVPDVLVPLEDDLLVGRRSGFAFFVDKAHQDRKVLAAVRSLNVNRNDYYDGPFDQLADNYADQTRIAEYMQLAAPALRGRIDKYGYYTDQERPMRVALSTYYSYLAPSDLIKFIERAKGSGEIYQYISRRGIPLATYPSTAPAEGPPTAEDEVGSTDK
jgi:hypothetical protein